jgi:DNA-binding beta-propeller fold protein YncE
MALGADKHTCRPLTRQQTLFIGMGDFFVLKQYRTFGRLDIGSPEVSYAYISRLAYNSLTGEVFVADNKRKTIYLLNLKTKVVQELVTIGIGEVSAMGFGE